MNSEGHDRRLRCHAPKVAQSCHLLVLGWSILAARPGFGIRWDIRGHFTYFIGFLFYIVPGLKLSKVSPETPPEHGTGRNSLKAAPIERGITVYFRIRLQMGGLHLPIRCLSKVLLTVYPSPIRVPRDEVPHSGSNLSLEPVVSQN